MQSPHYIAILLSIFTLFETSGHSRILEEAQGQTWNFAEENAIAEIQNTIERDKNKIEQRMNEARNQATKKLENYQPSNLSTLKRATVDRAFLVDMSYTLPHDIIDGNGKVLYRKGYTFNPLDTNPFYQKIVVINPLDPLQRQWLYKSTYLNDLQAMILITDGSALKITEEFKRPVMFLTEPISKRFNLQYSPSVVVQHGRSMAVYEYNPNKKVAK